VSHLLPNKTEITGYSMISGAAIVP